MRKVGPTLWRAAAVWIILTCMLTVFCGCAARKGKKLRVAMECGYAPYNWTQESDEGGALPIAGGVGYAYGYDVMIAKLLAEELGYELEIVKLDWDSLIPAVQSGDVDAVIAGQSIKPERLEKVDFTVPYYYASIVTLVKSDGAFAGAKGIKDLAGGTCTSQQGTIWYDVCLPQIENATILAAQDSAPTMLIALDSGAVDFVVCDLPTAQAALHVYPSMKILDFTDGGDNFAVTDEDINIGISVKKGNKKLVDAFNSVLSEMNIEDFDAMMQKAIEMQPLSSGENDG